MEEFREIGDMAMWNVSSAKHGTGVEKLRDGDFDSYWQSDDTHPHLVTAKFNRKVAVSGIGIYIDENRDESYTPSKISIRTGNSEYDMEEVHVCDIDNPCGWVIMEFPLESIFMIQIVVVFSNQYGKDTHIRQVHVYSPLSHYNSVTGEIGNQVAGYGSNHFSQYSQLR